MRKQYLITWASSFRYYVSLFHDGVGVKTVKKWEGDELAEYLDDIESRGYTRGFTQAVIDAAEEELKYLKDNLIEVK